jgi:MOSC domain-containing protein YiiM
VPGTVVQIAVSPQKEILPTAVPEVEVSATGVAGDRYGDAGDITLIEQEALEAFAAETGLELSHEESRRQVLTRGVRLNDLVGKTFKVGEVEVVGRELCEPCSHLQSITREGVLRGMVHRAGLNADVVTPGRIAVGDEVHV